MKRKRSSSFKRSSKRRRYYKASPYLKKRIRSSFRKLQKYDFLAFKTTERIDFNTNAGGLFEFAVNANGSPTLGNKYAHLLTGTSSTIGSNTYYSIADMTSLSAMWSSCRMAACKVRYIPDRPNDVYSTAILSPYVITYDQDGLEYGYRQYNIDNMIQTQCKFFSLNRFWKFYRKFPKRRVSRPSGYILYNQTTQPQGQQNIAGQFHDIGTGTFESEQPNGYHIYGRQTNPLTPSINYGTLYVTCYWVLKDRFK